MKAKRVIASLMALTLVAPSAMGIVSAADGTVAITASKVNAAAGADFSIDVSLADIPATGLCAVDFAVEFDSSLVTINDVTTGALCDTGAASAETTIDADLADTTFTWNVVDNQICIVWVSGLTDSSYWLQDGGVFVTISGTVNADAAAGSVADFDIVPVGRATNPASTTENTSIIVGYLDSSDAKVNYASTTTSGSVTVTGSGAAATLYGDVNCDGTVSVSDLILLARYAAEDTTIDPISDIGFLNADCEYDSYVNASDVAKIAGYMAHTVTADEMGPQ